MIVWNRKEINQSLWYSSTLQINLSCLFKQEKFLHLSEVLSTINFLELLKPACFQTFKQLCEALSLLQYCHVSINSILNIMGTPGKKPNKQTPLELTHDKVSFLIYYSTASTTKRTSIQTQEVLFQENFQEKTVRELLQSLPFSFPLYKHKSCFILFLSLSSLQANSCRLLGHMVTQAQLSCVKLRYLESKDVVRPKYYLIRWGISASAPQSMAAHLTFPFKSESGSSHKHSEHLLSYHTEWTLAASARPQHTEEQE